MNYRKYFKKLITGLTVHQQYVCLALESLEGALSIRLIDGKNPVLDVTHSHVFLGYKPVVIGLYYHQGKDGDILSEENVILRFYPSGKSGTRQSEDSSIAHLKLKRCKEQPEGVPVVLYQAVQGDHTFINSFYRFINRQGEKFRKKTKAFNIDLPGNERDQVRIAYAVPRVISLITVGKDELVNIFPTDLHGSINKGFYASSLRIGGRANEQVKLCGRIVISEIESVNYRYAYSLGKNHMAEMKPLNFFSNLAIKNSAAFGLPLPACMIRYRELEVISSCIVGIHQIYFYREVNREIVKEGNTLSHVDQYYVQWRMDHGLETLLLIR